MRPPPRGWAPKSFGGGKPPPRGCRHTALKIIACFLVGDSLGRERCRSVGMATQGRTTLRAVGVTVFATLRPTRLPPYASHLPSFAMLPSLCAPSVARPKSGSRHCFAEPRHYLCGVGFALRFASVSLPSPYSPLQGFGGGKPPPRGCRHTALKIIACFLVGIARSGTLVAPCGRSAAFPLPRFSPSLATLGHLPRWGIYMPFWGVRAAITAPPTAQPSYRHAQKRLGPFLCGVGYALRRALSEHRYERNRVPALFLFSYR